MTVEEYFGLTEEEVFAYTFAMIANFDHLLTKGINDPRFKEQMRSYKAIDRLSEAVEIGTETFRTTYNKDH